MAVTVPITDAPTAMLERTWRTNIETAIGTNPAVQIYRESVPVDGSNKPIGKGQQQYAPISRDVADDGEDTVRLGDGTMLSLAQVVEAFALFGDQWAEADKEGGGENPAEPAP